MRLLMGLMGTALLILSGCGLFWGGNRPPQGTYPGGTFAPPIENSSPSLNEPSDVPFDVEEFESMSPVIPNPNDSSARRLQGWQVVPRSAQRESRPSSATLTGKIETPQFSNTSHTQGKSSNSAPTARDIVELLPPPQ